MRSRIRVALVQPLTTFGAGARTTNLATAHRYALQAAAQGADIVCFPETFPGEWRMPVRWTPVEDLGTIAREAGIYVVGGYAEPLDGDGRRCFNSLSLLTSDGEEAGRYRRTSPGHAPWIYRAGPHWDFEWVPAEQLPVFGTDLGTVGMLICSEVYVPELARAMALKGADLLVLPAGLAGPASSLADTWRTMVWARAIENLCCTVMTSNVLEPAGAGLAMACTPEAVVLDTEAPGLHVADIDLDRIRWLREESDRLVVGEKPWRTKPGLLRDWRRPEVLAANPELGGPAAPGARTEPADTRSGQAR